MRWCVRRSGFRASVFEVDDGKEISEVNFVSFDEFIKSDSGGGRRYLLKRNFVANASQVKASV